MLSEEENELLTRTGAGTPMGDLMRRYWQPVAAVAEMEGRWTKRVRVMGEDLVLFKDRTGKLGLIAEQCPHRRASFAYGIPTAEGIRCPYHGWMFDGTGKCLEQPNEPEGSNFKDKVTTTGYPVQELAGLIFAYLGPLPAPLITKLDGYVADPAIRLIARTVIPCNWLQIQENSADPIHSEWLHGHFAEFVDEMQNEDDAAAVQRPPPQDRVRREALRHHQAPSQGRPTGNVLRLDHRAPAGVPEHSRGRLGG